MGRYTEYHAGKAVIRDRGLWPEAMEKLAKLEDMADIREKMCDEYCRYPIEEMSQDKLNRICEECELAKLFEVLAGKGET